MFVRVTLEPHSGEAGLVARYMLSRPALTAAHSTNANQWHVGKARLVGHPQQPGTLDPPQGAGGQRFPLQPDYSTHLRKTVTRVSLHWPM